MAATRPAVYANPYFTCGKCGEWVTGHDGTAAHWFNVPCGHRADIQSVCLSWGPVDGCQCRRPKSHGEPPSMVLVTKT